MSHPERPASGPAGGLSAPPAPHGKSGESLAEFAAAHGLTQSAARPRFGKYVASVWQRRHFIWMFATSKSMSMYSSSKLGQLWQVLTPILNAGVYYLVFGLILGAGKGMDSNLYIPFLVTGVFVFSFSQRSMTAGAKSVGSNLPLIRALHFPRATLPLAHTVVELQQLLVALVVLVGIVLAFGEPLTWEWILVVPAVLLQLLFNTGMSLALARIGAFTRDITQLLPFILRTWFYFSGVLFSLPGYRDKKVLVENPWMYHILEANPGFVYVELIRHHLLDGYSHYVTVTENAPDPVGRLWLYAVGWAVIALVGGFYWFYRAEERYGRG